MPDHVLFRKPHRIEVQRKVGDLPRCIKCGRVVIPTGKPNKRGSGWTHV